MRRLLPGACVVLAGCLQPNPAYLGSSGTEGVSSGSTTTSADTTGPDPSFSTSRGAGGESGSGGSSLPEAPCDGSLCFGEVRCFDSIGTPYRVDVAELDGDGRSDVVTLNDDGTGVEVWLSDPSGALTTFASYGSDVKPVALAAIDADQDGRDELAVGGGGLDSVVLFDPIEEWRRNIDVGAEVAALGTADANLDGMDDLAVAVFGETLLTWAIVSPNGTFSLGEPSKVDGTPGAMVLGHLDHDALPDAVLVVDQGDSLSCFNGNDGPGFDEGIGSQVGRRPYDIAAADLDHDGEPEVVITSSTPTTVDVLVPDGDATYSREASIALSETPGELGIADFDADGEFELAVAMQTVPEIWVYPGRPGFDYEAPLRIALPSNGGAMAVGDFNADGHPDLVATVQSQVCVALRVP